MPRERKRGRNFSGVLWVVHQDAERIYNSEDAEALAEQVRLALNDPSAKVLVLPPGCDLDAIDLDLLSSLGGRSEDGKHPVKAS